MLEILCFGSKCHDLHCTLSLNKVDDRGGFPDVFHDYYSLVNQKGCIYFEQLNYLLLNNLYHNKGIGLSYNASSRFNHIVSLWGAKFDANGNLIGVFITDSNDGKKLIDNKSGNTYGMIYKNIVKEVKTGAPKITNKVTPNGDVGSTVLGLQTLDTGKSIWENYFKSINSKS
ncbi:MAG: IdeS/Mac family cysteine endopeptidase [Paraclostridium sordellii]